MYQSLAGRIRATLDKPGPRKTNQSAAERIRSPEGESGPAGLIRSS